MRCLGPGVEVANAETRWRLVCETDEAGEEGVAGEDVAACVGRGCEGAVAFHDCDCFGLIGS